jgi:hypothetical protein
VDLITFTEILKTKIPEGVTFEVGRSRASTIKLTEGSKRMWKGYRVTLTNLTPEQSLAIQAKGVGHGKTLGCGVFYPGTL